MWYILEKENKPVKSTINQHSEGIEANPDKKVVKQENIGDIFVSTVFLGLDHAWNSDVPVLWETMIFRGEYDQYQDRYTSVEDALKGHKKALELLNQSL